MRELRIGENLEKTYKRVIFLVSTLFQYKKLCIYVVYGHPNLQTGQDVLFKDLVGAVEKVDVKPVKNVAIDALKSTNNIVKQVQWDSVKDSISNAGRRILNITFDALTDVVRGTFIHKIYQGDWVISEIQFKHEK